MTASKGVSRRLKGTTALPSGAGKGEAKAPEQPSFALYVVMYYEKGDTAGWDATTLQHVTGIESARHLAGIKEQILAQNPDITHLVITDWKVIPY